MARLPEHFKTAIIPSLKVTIRRNEEIRGTPLEDGATIMRHTNFPPKVDMNTKPVLEIAFAKGQVVDGEPVLPTLAQLAQLVEGTVEPFRQLP